MRFGVISAAGRTKILSSKAVAVLHIVAIGLAVAILSGMGYWLYSNAEKGTGTTKEVQCNTNRLTYCNSLIFGGVTSQWDASCGTAPTRDQCVAISSGSGATTSSTTTTIGGGTYTCQNYNGQACKAACDSGDAGIGLGTCPPGQVCCLQKPASPESTTTTTTTTTSTTTTTTTTTTTIPTKSRISVTYADVTAKAADGRDVIQLLKPIQPNYINRAYWKWGYTSDAKHQAYKEKIAEIKREIPSVTNVGGYFPLQFLINKTTLWSESDTWPNGTPISNKDFDRMIFHCKDGEPIQHYNGFMPDPRSKLFQDYVVEWMKKMKEAGVDSIHFDGAGLPTQPSSPSCGAISSPHDLDESIFKTIFDRVKKEAGLSVTLLGPKVGLRRFGYYSVWPNLDFADQLIWEESLDKPFTLHEDYAKTKEDMMIVYGKEIPLNLFLDSAAGSPDLPISKLVALSLEDRKTFLRMVDEAAKANGASLIYPVYGGDYYINLFNRGTYDSVKFGVYDTIIELAK